jgi:hypothetical protein
MSDQASNISELRELRATFASPDQMQDAIGKLSLSGFDRADLGVPTQPSDGAAPSLESNIKPPSTEDDARQARTLGASTAASVAAIAAAGVTVATGGAALPAIGAAIAAGGAVGAGAFAIHGAANNAEQHKREERASSGTLILTVRTPNPAKRAEAEAILQQAGATAVEAVN